MNPLRLFRSALFAGLLCGASLAGSSAHGQASDISAVAPSGGDSLETPDSAAIQVRPTSASSAQQGTDAAPSGGPYGKGAGWVPGMAEPKHGPEAGNGGGGDAAEAGQGKHGGGLILYDQLGDADAGDEAQQQDGAGQAVPEQYIVEKGDTLWSICARFFKNPYYWPKLWSFNDVITNPHWIYPGDLITMHAPGQHPAHAPTLSHSGDSDGRLPRLARATKGVPGGLFLHQNGFVEPGERDSAGVIIGSREEKIMLASLDEIYIEVNKQRPLKVKERYTIYKTLKPVQRPHGDGTVLGEVVEILGDVEVKQITSGGIARAAILEALGPIERGFRVGPLRRTYKLVDPKINAVNLSGVVVTALEPSELLDNQMLIFMDLGRASGIAVGNRLFVYRRGDAYPGLLVVTDSDDHRYPKEVVAEIMIVDVRDKTAAGMITRSIREVRVGDRVEARKGF